MSLLAQLSDPHIVAAGRLLSGGIDSAAMLRAALARLLRLPRAVDAVLITGDLVDRGGDEEYAHLLRLLSALPCPVYLMPGNHDSRPALIRHASALGYLGSTEVPGFVQYVRMVGALRLVVLDSHCPGAAYGELCAARLQWLADTLEQAPTTPTVIALHHPPFASGMVGMDSIALRSGGEELAAIVSRHPQVERVLCGHLHRGMSCRFGGTLAMSAPSTAHQMHLDLNPLSEAAYNFETPGFLLHHLGPQGLVSHTVNIGGDETPHGF